MDSAVNKKAALAYASINSQLANWYDDDNDEDYDDDMDDDDVNMQNLVSKRQSGSFSPMAMPMSNHGRNPDAGITSAQTRTPMTAKKSKSSFVLRGGPASVRSMKTSPISTPAAGSYTPMQHKFTASMRQGDGSNDDFDDDDGEDSTSGGMDLSRRDLELDQTATTGTARNDATSRQSFINQANLDGEFRPYYDALLGLKGNEDLLQYVGRIMASAYTRSSFLGDTMHESTSAHTNVSTKDATVRTKQQLEHEGHFWSLIANLLRMTHEEKEDMLLYQNPSISTIQSHVQSYISNQIDTYGHLDQASLAFHIQQCLVLGSEDNTPQQPIPTVIQRRQIILEWIQSCHNRSISALNLDKDDAAASTISTNKENIMWKDTTQKLNQQQHSFLPSSSSGGGTIQEIHPDAPYLHGTNRGGNNNALCGNDADKEVDLLHKCLLLMKAGRTADAFELCERMGEAWRAAAWDGDAPFGYMDVGTTTNDATGMEMDMQRQRVGNPQRALWKRNMWEVAASLNAMIPSHSDVAVGDVSSSSPSVVYEAAISAILADDTNTASNNPLLAKNWMDSVWIFYRGQQARFMEMIYHAHNNLKRSGIDVAKYPVEGTEFRQEEMEQLACTAEMSRMDEGAFLSRLSQQSLFSQSLVDGKAGDDFKKGISAFLTGVQDVERYLVGTMDTLIRVTDPESQMKMSREEYEPLLRFILHLVLFFDSLRSHDNHISSPSSILYSNAIAPRFSQLVHVYLKVLIEQKPLWEFTPLYASLLPEDQLIGVCNEFWSKSVFEERDRRMMLKHAREHFEEGLDLVILRDIVRMSFQSVPEEQLQQPLNTASWLGTKKASVDDIPSFDPELESMINPDDVRKMHSIRWLCFYNEHYADAIICANMLMRNLLLELPPSLGENEDCIRHDWDDSIKLYSAKVLQSRFLPSDIAQVAIDSIHSDISGAELKSIESSVLEYNALSRFFDAHNAYQSWKNYIDDTSSSIDFARDTRFTNNSVESDIAINMEVLKYIKKKRDVALRLIKFAEVAIDRLMQVLEYEGGWLYTEYGNDTVTSDSTDEAFCRYRETKELRSRILPAIVNLSFIVSHETACWMEEFTIDVFDSLDNNAAETISRITGQAAFEADEKMNPFEASTWHRKSLLLANIVASSHTKIAESMSKNELSKFMKCIVETNICLLVDQEGGANF